MSRDRYVIGVGSGTLSGRALVVRVSDGAKPGSATCEYPHGMIDRAGTSSASGMCTGMRTLEARG